MLPSPLFSSPSFTLVKSFLPCDASAHILISRDFPHANPPFSNKEASGRTVICFSCFYHLLLRCSDYHASCCSNVEKNIYFLLRFSLKHSPLHKFKQSFHSLHCFLPFFPYTHKLGLPIRIREKTEQFKNNHTV